MLSHLMVPNGTKYTTKGQYIPANGTTYTSKWENLYQQMGQLYHEMGQHIPYRWDNIYQQMGQFIPTHGTTHIPPIGTTYTTNGTKYTTNRTRYTLSLIHISEPTRLGMISYAVFCLK